MGLLNAVVPRDQLSVTANGGKLVIVADVAYDMFTSSSASGSNPGFALLPASGHFADLIGFYQASGADSASTVLASTTATPYYLIYWDNSGTAGA